MLQPNYAIASFPPNNVKFRTLGHLIFNKSDMRWILRCYVWWFDDSNWGSHMFSRPEGWESLDFTNSGTNTHTHARTVCRAFQLFGFHPTRADPKPKRQSETKIRGSARIDPSNYMTQIGSLDVNHGPELVFDLWSVTRFKQCISTYVHVFSLRKRKI